MMRFPHVVLVHALTVGSIKLEPFMRRAKLGPDAALYNERPLRDIYLIAGQSNAVGEGMVRDMPKEYINAPPHALVWPKFGATEWQPFTAFGESTNGYTNIAELFGPEACFAHQLSQTLYSDTDENFGIVKVAAINTDLAQDWSVGNWRELLKNMKPHEGLYRDVDATRARNILALNSTDYVKTATSAHLGDGSLPPGTLFALLVNNVRMAMMSPMCADNHCRVKALLWVQGEADASSRELGSNYLRNLETFTATLRHAISTPDLFVMVAQLAPDLADDDRHFVGFDDVQKAQEDWVKKEGPPRAKLISAEGLQKNKDRLHYSAEGQIELGRRFATAYLESLNA